MKVIEVLSKLVRSTGSHGWVQPVCFAQPCRHHHLFCQQEEILDVCNASLVPADVREATIQPVQRTHTQHVSTCT